MNWISQKLAAFRNSRGALPSLRERMDTRASDFQLISLRPYVTRDGLDMQKPYIFPAHMSTVAQQNVERAHWFKESISCADDICVVASKVASNVEVRAAGIDITTHEAVLEAARMPEAETARYIVFDHPIHKRKTGQNMIVLENAAATEGADTVLVISLLCETEKLAKNALLHQA